MRLPTASPRPTILRRAASVGVPAAALAAVLVSAGAAPSNADTTPSTPSTSPTTPTTTTPTGLLGAPIATFTSADDEVSLPRVSAGLGVVAWSEPVGKDWALRLATDRDGVLPGQFDTQPWPVDASVGARGNAPEVLWSHCPITSSAPRRRVANGCDIVRIPTVRAGATSALLGGASTRTFSETAPSRDGNKIVFSRRATGSDRASIMLRDLGKHANRTLAGGPLGSCKSTAICTRDGFLAGGAEETSVDGDRYAALWRRFGGRDQLGISDNETVLRGIIGRSTSRILTLGGGPGVISGTCAERHYSSVQQLGTVAQSVRHTYDCDSTPANGSDVVQRVTSKGAVTEYADPDHRRIVAASSDGDRLWLVREVRPYDYAASTGEPAFCSSGVGGCEVVAVDNPVFKPVERGA
ncbi:MAG: hypothetical protein PGN13_11530 [Patulibacter minatonensis]